MSAPETRQDAMRRMVVEMEATRREWAAQGSGQGYSPALRLRGASRGIVQAEGRAGR